jgi:AraC-like DNA-binding protein
MRITEAEASKIMRCFELLDLNARDEDETVFSVNIARSVIATIFYQMLQFNFMRISREADNPEETRSRRSSYVRDFMRLVHLNYTKHRTVAFYADKLFISPKYLTVLVKEATGRSAADWINEFVIIEAKNLLRFSGKNVQQVAYALSFTNQSSFGKYFKHLTGMSPSEYQKS